MRIETLPQEFKDAQLALKRLEDAGHEAYFVGGAVRDMLLNKPIHDVDIATSAFPEEVKNLFNTTVDTGIQHGTVMVLDYGSGYEITTFRTESTYTDFRRPDEVTFVRSLAEDLKRRDFTINALAMTYTGEMVDLFNGLSDLQKGVIRAVGDAEVRFTEDALRMMRALRFSAQLAFDIAIDTQNALKKLAPNLEKIAVERIRVEFEKLLQGEKSAQSLEIAVRDDVIPYLPGNLQNWNLTPLISDLKLRQGQHHQVVWAHLLSRSSLPVEDMKKFMRLWKTSREDIKAVVMIAPIARQINAANIFDLYRIYSYRKELLEVLQLIGTDTQTIENIAHLFKTLPIKQTSDLAINGNDLLSSGMISPGPEIGRMLKKLAHAVLLGEVNNTTDSLFSYVEELTSYDKN
ncbi:CCA tRNA nucleotidyltransferase [Leuconostoc rapi]|uniref:CCA tRNA nucleotidyltransferase n=1 Tax=Leuconostoc rapi TaxID=1406906 RepID=UPI00195A7498|nr:CCA tRNA nucleotidyltransferase [Leuconostoc rapi]MBM7435804.1 tRNA nucleotidyltransferase (CCA-adding enzyme) [Leuconostoc rapi]